MTTTTDTPKKRRAATIPAVPAQVKGSWVLWFVPAGSDYPKFVDRVKTAADGMTIAATHFRLDWMAHEALGSDAFIARAKGGAFILERMTR